MPPEDNEQYEPGVVGYVDSPESQSQNFVTSGYVHTNLEGHTSHNHDHYHTYDAQLQISNNTIYVDSCIVQTPHGTIEVNDEGITFNTNVRINGNVRVSGDLNIDSINFVDKDKDGNIRVVNEDPNEYIEKKCNKKNKMDVLMED